MKRLPLAKYGQGYSFPVSTGALIPNSDYPLSLVSPPQKVNSCLILDS